MHFESVLLGFLSGDEDEDDVSGVLESGQQPGPWKEESPASSSHRADARRGVEQGREVPMLSAPFSGGFELSVCHGSKACGSFPLQPPSCRRNSKAVDKASRKNTA